MQYANKIRELLTPVERRVFERLTTPQKIQDYLDTLPVNFEVAGETYMSPRRVLGSKTAHCFEGALLAAAALVYHDQKPLLMDFRTISEDEDHVVALFKKNGYWGAISKTNHAILRYRDPIYKTVRELAASYFHEYVMWEDGRKTLREYSKPIDISLYPPEKWVTAGEDLHWLVEAIDSARHFPLVSRKNLRHLRPATKFEINTVRVQEWKNGNPRSAVKPIEGSSHE